MAEKTERNEPTLEELIEEAKIHGKCPFFTVSNELRRQPSPFDMFIKHFPTAEQQRETIIIGYLKRVANLIHQSQDKRETTFNIPAKDADIEAKVNKILIDKGYTCSVTASQAKEDGSTFTISW